MTKEEFAEMLTGREYGNEISDTECEIAAGNNFIVVFGYSDDTIELRGAIHDEIGYDRFSKIRIRQADLDFGAIVQHDCDCAYCNFKNQTAVVEIEPVWCGPSGWSWAFNTSADHATFEIHDDSERYCLGIVIDIK